MLGFFERRFTLSMLVLCGLYLGTQCLYVATLPLVMDEFQGAHAVRRLATGLPYRDFIPYKTVLGYYLQLLPLQLTRDTWAQLIAVKLSMAAWTAAGVFFTARLLARQYRRSAICLGTILLFCMSTFLERSAELRVDMLTSLAGLVSLALLLDRRFAAAGALAGASFLLSQKGIYFIFAGALACGAHWLRGRRRRPEFVDCVRFISAAAAPIAAYVMVWGALSSFTLVMDVVFFAHSDIALDDLYDISRYWFHTLRANPYFYALAVLALGQLFARRRAGLQGERDSVLFVYGGVILVLGLWHRQPWPYFFVILIPTFYVLVIAFLDAELERAAELSRAFVVTFCLLGVVVPLQRVKAVLSRDNGFQRSSVRLAEAILEPGDTYLAGTEMLPGHQQAAARHLAWLDRRHLLRVGFADKARLIAELEASPPKLILMNYRIAALPPRIRQYLADNYQRYYGAAHTYSPLIRSQRFQIGLDGVYELRAQVACELDGRRVEPGQHVALTRGSHTASMTGFRLALVVAPPSELLDPRYADDQKLFDRPYDY